jgi:hypothetical protein
MTNTPPAGGRPAKGQPAQQQADPAEEPSNTRPGSERTPENTPKPISAAEKDEPDNVPDIETDGE